MCGAARPPSAAARTPCTPQPSGADRNPRALSVSTDRDWAWTKSALSQRPWRNRSPETARTFPKMSAAAKCRLPNIGFARRNAPWPMYSLRRAGLNCRSTAITAFGCTNSGFGGDRPGASGSTGWPRLAGSPSIGVGHLRVQRQRHDPRRGIPGRRERVGVDAAVPLIVRLKMQRNEVHAGPDPFSERFGARRVKEPGVVRNSSTVGQPTPIRGIGRGARFALKSMHPFMSRSCTW